MCHPLNTAFQVLVKFGASVGKRVLLWISGTHLQQLAHQGNEQWIVCVCVCDGFNLFNLSFLFYLPVLLGSAVSAHENYVLPAIDDNTV